MYKVTLLTLVYQGFSWTEIYYGHFVKKSLNIVRTFGSFLGLFFRHSIYHHKPKLLSAITESGCSGNDGVGKLFWDIKKLEFLLFLGGNLVF